MRDFIPHKTAMRIRDLITFTVKLKGRCPDLVINDETKTILAEMDRGTVFDYESIPTLKDYKIRVLGDQIR